MGYLVKLENYSKAGKLQPQITYTLREWYDSYSAAAKENGRSEQVVEPILQQFLDLVVEQIDNPFQFEPYHQRLTQPLDLYKISLEFVRPLVKIDRSVALHLDHADQMEAQLKRGENVILLANHQTEMDPQAISLLLEKTHPQMAQEMIFVAGHRVVSDPMAVPFSKGVNLLCIYSKKYIETDPSLKEERLLHNQKTMMQMSQLLAEGGKCIYVAPSGGRDRPNSKGEIEVAPFDPQSIELFWLMAQRSNKPTHFYPLALATYALLPPPDNIRKNIGERRHTNATPIALAFGPEVDMEGFLGTDIKDKKSKRKERALFIWERVKRDYDTLMQKIAD
ncbi:MAG: 1-acyl-sn-glycerol-3-phosphate acyltransferase [Parachlamydiaceae bacterium]|nr:1-acyl-sn-glycerol-3-phosphate acyltransferase [Parachlamydiaceae bacterium]